ncbi:type II toxin-antitoxin system RelE/ParE family toxin [Caulobacter sp. BK020]|uniref:type II toxin-antitoxin system RelE/ParE family toxin n=1 Tax=Caulobacter sp. BK020 TaxID=2512117 RepID=UPI001043F878|nr:type II toxin-antitoxin system RelE/ParE family toxin [Caulobacter sp. BK020]TCS13980.1 plasmid stabilization system protein ParE [Caulobacter sp. BK020]
MNDEIGRRYRIVWSLRSRRDIEGIHAYIAQVAPLAAGRFISRLIATVESLADQPLRGRPLYGQVREMVAVRPYVVRYRVRGGAVQIIRIKHSAQDSDQT